MEGSATMARAEKAGTNPILQLKITLKGTKPPIWRRIQVESSNTLGDLHSILQIVIGWTDSHMHAFEGPFGTYGRPMPGDFMEIEDEEQAKLVDVLGEVKSRLRYDYDFGDNWEHDVVVEKIVAPESGVTYPRCIAGKRNCPPEDCGGVWGFYDMLDAARDPKHAEHEEYAEWLGDAYDEETFDLEETNACLVGVIKKERRWRKEMRKEIGSM